jgi:hypothetical protein
LSADDLSRAVEKAETDFHEGGRLMLMKEIDLTALGLTDQHAAVMDDLLPGWREDAGRVHGSTLACGICACRRGECTTARSRRTRQKARGRMRPDTSNLKPYGPRVTCLAPEDTDDNTSRIVLRWRTARPAIVREVGETAPGENLPHLEPGDLIFFSHVCNKIGDLYIIEFNCIVAYEKLGDQGDGEESLA